MSYTFLISLAITQIFIVAAELAIQEYQLEEIQAKEEIETHPETVDPKINKCSK